MRLRCALGLVHLLVLIALVASPAAARPSPQAGARAAERALSVRLVTESLASVQARCKPAGGRSWRCDWMGSAKVNGTPGKLCFGRRGVRRVGARWRFGRLRRGCHNTKRAKRLIPAPPAHAPPPRPGPGPKPTPPPADPATPAPAQYFGFSEHVEDRPGLHADLARGVRGDSQRLTMPWNWAEPSRDRYALEGFDSTYRASIARGIRPLITILFSPRWTWSPDVSCDPAREYCPYPPDPAFYGEWREFVAIIARRYPKAVGIEIWNEQNLTAFWRPAPDPERYAALLKEAYTAVKGVSPTMPVIAGGLANNDPSADRNISYIDFLRATYRAGAKSYMDGIGIHPYNPGIHSAFLEGTLANVRAVRDGYGDRTKPLWVTEFGLTTSGNPWPRAWSEQEQATGLTLQYQALARMPDVRGVFLHTLVEPPLDRPGSPEPGYGLVRPDFTPKPAYCAIAAARGGTGCS